MCGIWGIVVKSKVGFSTADIPMIENLAIAGSARGRDSLGIMNIDIAGKWSYLKAAGNPFELIESKDWTQRMEAMVKSGKAIVGHNRHATKGAVNKDNAHPFNFGNTTLVHNGTILHGLTYDKGITVDSNQLCIDIDRYGIDQALDPLYGAWAVVYHDYKKNTLNFIRNKERPLYFIKADGGFMFGSELKMLEWIADRHQFLIANRTRGSFNEDTLYTVELDQYNYSSRHEEDWLKTRPCGKKPHVYSYYESGEEVTTYQGGAYKKQEEKKAVENLADTAPRHGATVKFKLNKKQYRQNNQVRYTGITNLDEPVMVDTSIHNDIEMGKLLVGKYQGVCYVGGKGYFSIKTRSIEEYQPDPETEEEPVVLKTKNGTAWTKDRFETAMNQQNGCANCSGHIAYSDLPECIEYADCLICPVCAYEYREDLKDVGVFQ